MIKDALSLARDGWRVFPCVPNDKAPLVPRGVSESTTNIDQIQLWWNRWPSANIGLATGRGVVVIDVDTREGALATYKALLREVNTYTVRTGKGGLHLYYKYDEKLTIRNKVNLFPGIDVRADGGYVLVPPSQTNALYKIETDMDLQPLPKHLLEQLINKPEKKVAIIQNNVLEGGRNDYIMRAASAMLNKGLDKEAVVEACLIENTKKCSPPLEDDEIEAIVDSVSRYAPNNVIQLSKTNYIKAFELFNPMCLYLQNKDKVQGEPTGFKEIDGMLGGGKRTGELTVWHAEAKTGKNAFWHKLMHIWLTKGIPIGYASRELSPETEVLPNLLSIEYKKNAWLDNLTKAEAEAMLKKWPLYFSKGYGFFNIVEIENWIKDLKNLGVRYFYFDHLHYMLEEPEEHKDASKLIKQLKTWCKEQDIHIDIIVQPNKLMEGQRLGLGTIKGGAAIGQALDNLFILEREKNEDKKDILKVKLDVARSRLATPGETYFEYNRNTTDFIELNVEYIKEIKTVDPKSFKPWVFNKSS